MPSVVSWIHSQDAMQLFITTITIAEISYGINVRDFADCEIEIINPFT